MFVLVSVKKEWQLLCEQYWDYDSGFKYDLDSIARAHSLSVNTLIELVKKGCLAYFKGHVCNSCGDPLKLFQTREEFFFVKSEVAAALKRRTNALLNLCIECEVKIPLNLNHLPLPVCVNPELLKKMEEAFTGGVYESLNLLEFNFLKNLCVAGDFNKACMISGLHPKSGRVIYNYLIKLYLIGLEREQKAYYILPALSNSLKKTIPKKSIFGSQNAEELFRLLKTRYYHIFPEVRLSVFIDPEQVKSAFLNAWEKKYFHFARVDFLVCERQGFPLMAAEYDGGYHAVDSYQQQKDAFKDKILQAAGLKLVRYTKADLLKGRDGFFQE